MTAVSRRFAFSLPLLAAPIAPAFGQSDKTPEWLQSYDTGSRIDAITRASSPLLSQQTAEATQQTIEKLRAVVAKGGWSRLPDATLRVGSRGAAVRALRARLVADEELSAEDGGSDIYDTIVENAVRRIQARYGLNVTGVVTSSTINDMNIPAETRLRQLEVNLVRLRALAGAPGGRFVMVNIPGAQIEAVENGRVVSRHIAGVGKTDRQSPILTSQITEVNFNPFWTVPASIIRKDLIPKMRVEPNYLTENRIRIYTSQGQELQPAQVNWNSDEAIRYMFRQDPGGEFNSLGYVRINFPNPHGVYMHDTPSKGIFGDEARFVSSGCVRVQNVRGFIEWLLRDNAGWDRMRIDEEFKSGRRTDLRLATPVTLYWTYLTAWATPEGAAHFRDDIYGKDGIKR